jgi:azurin
MINQPTDIHQRKAWLPLFIPVAIFLLISCGGEKKPAAEEQVAQETESAETYFPSAAEAVYDPEKIDATAPVMEKTLEAIGNSMDVMAFAASEIRVKAGTTVKLKLVNQATDAAMRHNFFIVKMGTMEQVAAASLAAGAEKSYIPDERANLLFASKIVDPGQTAELIFAAPPVGEYQFVCTYPGHWQRMNGKFIVE